jgi:pimeloyl-ACP methyl ester carboxylesterase
MSQPIHILYLSGFGDNLDPLRLRALKRWKFKNITVELVPMRWDSKETFEQKIARIDQAMDRVRGKRIALLGESAGGSMVVHMYARRGDELYKAVTLCGKNARPETVGEQYYKRSPAFRTSMEKLNESMKQLTAEQRKQFVSIHPLYDPVVPVRDTLLKECQRLRLFAIGHAVSIALALTVYSPLLMRAIRR